MQINFIADPHFHGKLFESKLEVFNNALQRPADLHVVVGDLLHNARLGDGEVNQFRMVAELNRSFQLASAPVILIEGNHDQFGSRGSALDFFHWPTLTKVANQPQYFAFEDTELVCIPWIRNRSDWKQLVLGFLNAHEGTKKYRIIAAHMNVKDSFQNKNFRVNPDDHFVFSIEELRNTAFSPTDLICGHLHTRQVFQGIRGGYVGGMTQNNFGESGNPAGYLAWAGWQAGRDPQYRYKTVEAPEFFNTTEHEFEACELENFIDFFKFETEHPERYSGFANVVCVDPAKPEIAGAAEAFDGRIELSQLIGDYCRASGQEIPEIPFLTAELEKISLSISRAQTGLDEIEWVRLEDVGPHKHEIVHRATYAEFEKGLNVVTGKNGRGKTMLLESVLAGLYGSYVERGALKNYCHGKVAFGLSSKGEYVTVEHRPNPKGGLVAYFNDLECKLKGALATEVVPRFGDSNVFESVVFMDQGSKKDLVEAGEARRLEILGKLLNLEILEEHRKLYSVAAKEEKAKLARLVQVQEREQEKRALAERFEAQLAPLLPPDTAEIMRLESLIENRRKHQALFDRYAAYLEIKNWLDLHPGEHHTKITELRNRQERCRVLDFDINRMKQVLSQKGIGCGPNFLPCSLLRGASQGQLLALLEEYDEKKLDSSEEETLQFQYEIEGKRAQLHRKYEEAFDFLPERAESDTEAQATLRALKADRDLYLVTRRELDLAQEGHRKVLEELSRLEASEEALRGYEFLERLCSKKGLPLYVISSIVVGLQKQLDEILEMSGLDLKMKISLSKEADAEVADSFHILYSTRGWSYAPVKVSSGGQRQMIRVLFKLALMLYLNKYFGNYKVLIMDEPEKGLDVDNLDTLMRLLGELKGRLNQVIVVTHNQQIEAIADNVVRL